MGQIFELSKKIDEIISKKGMDKMVTRGKIGIRSGVLMSFNEKTPDNPERIRKIKEAVKEVLGVTI
jgi:uncharacterized protein YqgV (UPF0045/DUF77 family)